MGIFVPHAVRTVPVFSRGHVLAQHYGKPDAALNTLIKAVSAEDQDGKAELAMKEKSSPKNQIDPCFSHENSWITNTNNSQSFSTQETSIPVQVEKKKFSPKIPSQISEQYPPFPSYKPLP